jgi:hypothetical protein
LVDEPVEAALSSLEVERAAKCPLLYGDLHQSERRDSRQTTSTRRIGCFLKLKKTC